MLFGTRRWSALLTCSDEELAGAAARVLGGLWVDVPELPSPSATFDLVRDGRGYSLTVEGEQWSRWPEPGPALADLHWSIIDTAFRSRPGTMAFHAGVVELEGARILIPGDTEHGKSSLVLAACQAGALYGGDDLAWLDLNTRSVIPFPIALTLSRQAVERFGRGLSDATFLQASVERDEGIERRYYLSPGRFSGGIAREGSLAAVVIRHPPYSVKAELKRLGLGEGLRRLYYHAQFRWEERAEVFQHMGWMMEQVPVYEAVGEAENVVSMLPQLVGSRQSRD